MMSEEGGGIQRFNKEAMVTRLLGRRRGGVRHGGGHGNGRMEDKGIESYVLMVNTTTP